MADPTILMISESENVITEVLACFQAHKPGVRLIPVRNWEALNGLMPQANFQVVISDASSKKLGLLDVLERCRQSHSSCLFYGLFDALEPERISAFIRRGGTSFGLKDQLSALIATIPENLAEDQPNTEKPTTANQEYFLKVFFEQSADSIWAKNKEGRYLLINPAGAQFLSKRIEDILGKSDYEVFPPETASRIIKSDQQVIQTGVTEMIEDLIINRDGAKRTFQAVKNVLRDANGQVQGVIGTVRDITARKQAEEALRESEMRFRLLIENVKDYAIYMLDPAGYVTTWNISAERLNGYDSQEIIGKHFSCFFSPEAQECNYPDEILKKALNNGHFEQEGLGLRKDGSSYWANIITTPLFNEENQLIGFSNIVRDMSERKEAEESLKYYAQKLEQSNQDLEQFAFIASHDLQAPLRKVKIFSEILQQSAGEENRDVAERLQASVTKMQLLISDLLSLSRVNRQGKPLEKTELNAVIEDVLDNLEVVLQEQNASIHTDNLEPVWGDHAQLVQLFQNIIGNGIKFHKQGISPTIHIQGKRADNGFYEIKVQDNGIGFPEKHLAKIFHPFERLHNDSQYPGTGMGLAICKKITERHGGQLTASSIEGEGSTFIIRLPLITKNTPHPPGELSSTKPGFQNN
ncbi:MAG: histidine kinase [Vampirovibrio sp.]|jgi:PAS domain S-box-containing protein|nr:histidine kinase [Vampirovibrio sp.]